MVDHLFAGANLDPGSRPRRTIGGKRRSLDSGEVAIVTVGIADEEGIGHGTTVAPVNLEIDERFIRHTHKSYTPVE